MALTIGLTGGICSGKSTVAALFENKGIMVIDADIIAREVVMPDTLALSHIVEHFGKTVLHPEGTLNRQALRQLIFDNSAERIWLERLLHPLIRQKMILDAQQSTSPYTILMIPLLIESLPHPGIQRILVVDVPETLQLQRVMDREQLSMENAKKILIAQAPRAKRLQHADDVICNEQSIESLRHYVDELHQLYLSLSQGK
jgi:dephospho-CoA kinase